VRHDFLPWLEAVRIILAVTNSRQSRLPSRRVEREGVPTVIAPGFARLVRLFENHVVNGQPFQIVADRKAGLPSADDDGVCASQHDTLLVTTERQFRPLIGWFARHDAEVLLARRCHKTVIRHMIVHEA
jgi:hypothetical protein